MSRVLPLRWLIPLLLLGLGVIITSITSIQNYRYVRHDTEDLTMRRALAAGHLIVPEVERGLNDGDSVMVDEHLHNLLLLPNSLYVFILDENDTVVHSSERDFIGLPASKTPASEFGDYIERARRRMNAKTATSADRNYAAALLPIHMPLRPGELSPTATGILFVQFDLRGPMREAVQNILWSASLTAGIALLMSMLVALYLRHNFGRDLDRLVTAVSDYADGRPFPVFRPRSNELGRIVEVLSTMFRELTRKQEALQASERRFRRLFDSAADAVLLCDEKGRIIDANEVACNLLGHDRSQLLLLGLEDLQADTAGGAHALLADLTVNGHGIAETSFRRQDGSTVPVEVKTARFPEGAGAVATYFAAVRDISERKAAEKERATLVHRLADAEKLETVGRLAGGIAHDFNNMLGVIIGNAEYALIELPPGAPERQYLSGILDAATRSAALTRQLLTFARKQTIAPRVISLSTAIDNMLKMLRRLIGEHIELIYTPDAGPLHVRIDPVQLDQLFTNLLLNARDAIYRTGTIRIETSTVQLTPDEWPGQEDLAPGQYVLIAVSDSGRGMDAETKAHIFEPFYTTKGIGEGTGLGLATVYGIVRQNQGFINVYSELGRGTTFRIYLPSMEPVAERPARLDAEKIPGGNETILVVEDEPCLLALTSQMLEGLGYTVLRASAPSHAMDLAKEHARDITLLLTDVVMPEMNGRELAEHVRGECPGIKVLYMSGYTSGALGDGWSPDHTDLLLQKPFSRVNLAQKVREALAG